MRQLQQKNRVCTTVVVSILLCFCAKALFSSDASNASLEAEHREEFVFSMLGGMPQQRCDSCLLHKPVSARTVVVEKGKAPVDPESGKVGIAHVYTEGKDIYDVMLNQVSDSAMGSIFSINLG